MRKRRYRAMDYVYKRDNGLYEIRYPVPVDVRHYFPKRDGKSFKKHIIASLGTRSSTEANRLARSKFIEIENKFSVLREGAQSAQFASFCQFVFDQEMEFATHRRLDWDTEVPLERLDEEIRIRRTSLKNRSIDALEAHVGWMVDYYFERAAGAKAVVPNDTELRNALLNAAADVMSDVHTQTMASSQGLSYKPKLTAAPLLAKSEPVIVPGESIPLSKEGRLSLEQYWHVHEKTKQSSSSPVAGHTLKRRSDAWTELKQLLGADTPLFKVTKADIWKYRDALTKAPARAGSIVALRDLTFPERVEAMEANPRIYKNLNPNSVGDRLRQINAVFRLAVRRGHISENPAHDVFESNPDPKRYRDPYSVEELQRIFSSPPFYDRPVPVSDQNDEFWVPLLALFQGARVSEMFVRIEDVDLTHTVPHIKLVEFDERTLKNGPSSRLVPIHPEILKLGFLDYCRNVGAKHELLFPDWEFREDQKPSEGAARRRFNRHLKKLMPDRAYPADTHTFRHNFETSLSAAKGVPERIMLRLSGRSVHGSAGGYVHDVPILPDLAEAVAKVRYEGLSLEHLY